MREQPDGHRQVTDKIIYLYVAAKLYSFMAHNNYNFAVMLI